jgi:hypothetical protein
MDPVTITSIVGMVFPSIFDFVKKKFLKHGEDSPEETLNSLVTTKPELMANYISAMSSLFDAKTKYFNRDVVGSLPIWVSSLRACIRPISVILSMGLFIASWATQIQIPDAIASFMALNVSSWFGDRLI